jgi:WH2 motif
MLDSIRAGGHLRKVDAVSSQQAAAAASDAGRGGLLGEIKNRNFQLKAVDRTAAEEKKPAVASGGLSSIMDVLARRTAIVGNDSDSDDNNDEWDED